MIVSDGNGSQATRSADASNVGQSLAIGMGKAEMNSLVEPSLEVHLKRVVV